MKLNYFSIIFIFIALFSGLTSCSQKAYRYWTFDGNQPFKDSISGLTLDLPDKNSDVNIVTGIKGKGLDLSANGLNTVRFKSLVESANINQTLTINFFFKGSKFRYQTLSTPHFYIQFEYPYIRFLTTVIKNGKNHKTDWRIELNGINEKSFNYYVDGQWHMFTFVIDAKAGKKHIYVDGKLLDGFSKEIPENSKIVLHQTDGFRSTDIVDEISFYNKVLTSSQIALIYKNYNKNLVSSDRGLSSQAVEINSPEEIKLSPEGFDKLEFAPGYPDYNVQAIDQLIRFPNPRFNPKHSLGRNFPWMDVTYFHRELPGNGGAGIGRVDAQRAVKLNKLLYDKWNYYFEIPVLRNDKKKLDQQYSALNSIPAALINYAKANNDLLTAAIIMQIQGRPIDAGFESAKPYISSQNLNDKYYLKDSKGNPVIHSRKKWLSPLAPLDYIYKDAKTSAFYLKEVEKHLGRPIDFLNENGEFFGHIWSFDLLEKDPAVAKDIKNKNWDVFKYNGWFQQKLDTAYKNEILRSLNWKNTRYTLYNVTAMQPNYWPDYSMRRQTNDIRNGIHYSTPNFYPARPENWRQNAGTYNGYGQIADGRKREIALGDKLFAPFVSAGWRFEEENIRPAQWLALLKSMVMLGAEYFHVGYFNITGTKGWPNGKGPFDPRGYAYQAAMPVYAQAIGSQVFDFLTDGELLNPQPNAASTIYSYRFKASHENHLVVVRKLKNQYLIYGSIQANSNLAGNVPDEAVTEIELEGRKIKFNIRRQGSMYIYIPRSSPKFIQLDGWHQNEHPYYWSQDYIQEAELSEKLNWNSPEIKTEGINEMEFSNSVSFVQLSKGQSLEYQPDIEENYSKIILRIRAKEPGEFSIGNKNLKINNKDWQEIESLQKVNPNQKLIFKTVSGKFDIDYFILKN